MPSGFETTTPSTPPLLPLPPDTFDLVGPLHALLIRVTQDPFLGAIDDPSLFSPTSANPAPLAIKDFALEALKVKYAVADARKAVSMLPDVERSVEEQKAEIRALEAKLRRQREVLGRMAGRAAEVSVQRQEDENGMENE